MTRKDIRQASLEEILAMRERGETRADAEPVEDDEPEDDVDDDGIWGDPVVVNYNETPVVELTLDPLTYALFKQIGGDDPAARMLEVLKVYAQAELRKKRHERGGKIPHPDAAE